MMEKAPPAPILISVVMDERERAIKEVRDVLNGVNDVYVKFTQG
jgi:hypothetical protein